MNLMTKHPLVTFVRRWRNPYVTDGLVAMWDGEWNAGGGKHDASATVWKDLAGSTDLVSNGSPSWGDNYSNHSVAANAWISSINFDSVVPNMLSGVGGAIEVVTECIVGQNNRIITASSIAKLNIRQNCADQNRIGFSISIGSSAVGLTYGTRPARGSATCLSTNGKWSLIQHAGGVDYTDSRGSTTYPIVLNQKVSVGCRIENTSDSFYLGKIFCVRYYDRTLTAAEISANYAVDSLRFGIGG